MVLSLYVPIATDKFNEILASGQTCIGDVGSVRRQQGIGWLTCGSETHEPCDDVPPPTGDGIYLYA
jgi:hypothetical protein